jgi:hypothetical protein
MIVGRDHLIRRIWKQLETHSLRFTAERRVGKTTVLKEMARNPPKDVVAIFIDLEGVSSPLRFAETLLTHVAPALKKLAQTKTWFTGLMDSIGGIEIAGIVKLPENREIDWQSRIEKLLEGLSECHPDKRIVLLFDELPYMLQKIHTEELKAGATHNSALGLLDVLRAKRKPPSRLRMVYCGSVGLHHVISGLRNDQVAAEPFNDMPIQEIRELSPADAQRLAASLLEQDGVTSDDPEHLAATVAELGDGVPFYIERIVARLADHECKVKVDDARKIVDQQLSDDRNEWEMEHFRSRIPIYYPGEVADSNGRPVVLAKIVARMLDGIAAQAAAQDIDEIWNDLKSGFALDDRALVIRLLMMLAQDHYLCCDTEKRYTFRYALLRKWWMLAQGLKAR